MKKEGTPGTSTATMPGGIPYIVGNELAERFSFYGMRAILFIYMTQYLTTWNGQPDMMSEVEANIWFHNFASAVYFFPFLGALLSDLFIGKYRTIIGLSIVYCLGHFVLALFEDRTGLFWGLILIAIGAGGIKPCVSAHVGDQFTKSNQSLISRAFSYFYFSINLGSAASQAITPVLLVSFGASVAFGVPGVLMGIATLVFWIGRKKYITIPAVGLKKFKEEVMKPDTLRAIGGLAVMNFFIAVFWSLYDQTGSTWISQATKMEGQVSLFGYSFTILPSQVQAINPVFILILIPVFSLYLYPWVHRKITRVTPLRKIFVGFWLTALSFLIIGLLQERILQGENVSILWQLLPYLIITAGEVLVSISALEYSYTQAPNSIKSLIMSMYLLSISLGNVLTSQINQFIQSNPDALYLQGANYFYFFTGFCLLASMGFLVFAYFYKEKTFIQDVATS